MNTRAQKTKYCIFHLLSFQALLKTVTLIYLLFLLVELLGSFSGACSFNRSSKNLTTFYNHSEEYNKCVFSRRIALSILVFELANTLVLLLIVLFMEEADNSKVEEKSYNKKNLAIVGSELLLSAFVFIQAVALVIFNIRWQKDFFLKNLPRILIPYATSSGVTIILSTIHALAFPRQV